MPRSKAATPATSPDEDYERIVKSMRESSLRYYYNNKEKISAAKREKRLAAKAQQAQAAAEAEAAAFATTIFNAIKLVGGDAAVERLKDPNIIGALCANINGLHPQSLMAAIIAAD